MSDLKKKNISKSAYTQIERKKEEEEKKALYDCVWDWVNETCSEKVL